MRTLIDMMSLSCPRICFFLLRARQKCEKKGDDDVNISIIVQLYKNEKQKKKVIHSRFVRVILVQGPC